MYIINHTIVLLVPVESQSLCQTLSHHDKSLYNMNRYVPAKRLRKQVGSPKTENKQKRNKQEALLGSKEQQIETAPKCFIIAYPVYKI